jgi:hypothetical protein
MTPSRARRARRRRTCKRSRVNRPPVREGARARPPVALTYKRGRLPRTISGAVPDRSRPALGCRSSTGRSSRTAHTIGERHHDALTRPARATRSSTPRRERTAWPQPARRKRQWQSSTARADSGSVGGRSRPESWSERTPLHTVPASPMTTSQDATCRAIPRRATTVSRRNHLTAQNHPRRLARDLTRPGALVGAVGYRDAVRISELGWYPRTSWLGHSTRERGVSPRARG